MKAPVFFVVVLICGLVGASPASAASTLSVPGQYATIQAAITAAAEGDTVLVAPGVYLERIDFGTKEITVASTDGAAQTVIDGGDAGSVVVMNAEPGESPTLRGFTVRNGRAMAADGFDGGGIRTSGGPAVIEDNIIVGNETCGGGGGIAARFSSAIIRRNTIEGNFQAHCTGGPGGGGVLIIAAGSVMLAENVIRGNSHGSVGAGVSVFEGGTPTIARNVIASNTGPRTGGGIWIANWSDAQIENNVIAGNSATEGAGVWWLVPMGLRGPALVNNTIVDNTGSVGTALYAVGFDSSARAANNILIGGGRSVVHCSTLYDPAPPIIEFNDVVHAAGGPRYEGACVDQTGTNGNVSLSPGFVDPANYDFHLNPTSPLVDIGTNTAVPVVDLDGHFRIADGNGDGVAVTDIGADEAFSVIDTTPPVLTVPGPMTVNATSPQGANVPFEATATDNVDPTPAVTCVPAPGSTFAIGTTTVNCTAQDDGRNSSTASFTITVIGAADQIAALRAQVVLLPDERLGRSLDSKLRDAAAAVAAGQKTKACTKLAAFVAEVRSHSGGKIPAETAAGWIADATRIRAVIGC